MDSRRSAAMQITLVVFRGFQILFATVTLALSIILAKDQHYGSVPTQTGWAAFTGALGIIAFLMGIAGLYKKTLGPFVCGLDAIAGLALLAGAITYTVTLRGVSCSVQDTYWNNVILSGGCVKNGNTETCMSSASQAKSHCVVAHVDASAMFLGCSACALLVCRFFLIASYAAKMRKGGNNYA